MLMLLFTDSPAYYFSCPFCISNNLFSYQKKMHLQRLPQLGSIAATAAAVLIPD